MRTSVGYTGGDNENPTYYSVCQGDGHTEAVRVEYDPEQISYQDLLDRYWEIYVGPGSKAQYKAAIWCETDEEVDLAKKSLKKEQDLAKEGKWMEFMVADRAVTIEKAHSWHDAEPYHQHHLFGPPTEGK